MKKLRTRRLVVRRSKVEPQGSDTSEFGVPRVRLAKVALSSDRQLQTFEDALRDTIEQNRGALRKLAKR